MPGQRRKPGQCADCGAPGLYKVRVDRPKVCTDCAVKRVRLAAQQMRDKAGPAYEAWLKTNGPTGKRGAEQDKE